MSDFSIRGPQGSSRPPENQGGTNKDQNATGRTNNGRQVGKEDPNLEVGTEGTGHQGKKRGLFATLKARFTKSSQPPLDSQSSASTNSEAPQFGPRLPVGQERRTAYLQNLPEDGYSGDYVQDSFPERGSLSRKFLPSQEEMAKEYAKRDRRDANQYAINRAITTFGAAKQRAKEQAMALAKEKYPDLDDKALAKLPEVQDAEDGVRFDNVQHFEQAIKKKATAFMDRRDQKRFQGFSGVGSVFKHELDGDLEADGQKQALNKAIRNAGSESRDPAAFDRFEADNAERNERVVEDFLLQKYVAGEDEVIALNEEIAELENRLAEGGSEITRLQLELREQLSARKHELNELQSRKLRPRLARVKSELATCREQMASYTGSDVYATVEEMRSELDKIVARFKPGKDGNSDFKSVAEMKVAHRQAHALHREIERTKALRKAIERAGYLEQQQGILEKLVSGFSTDDQVRSAQELGETEQTLARQALTQESLRSDLQTSKDMILASLKSANLGSMFRYMAKALNLHSKLQALKKDIQGTAAVVKKLSQDLGIAASTMAVKLDGDTVSVNPHMKQMMEHGFEVKPFYLRHGEGDFTMHFHHEEVVKRMRMLEQIRAQGMVQPYKPGSEQQGLDGDRSHDPVRASDQLVRMVKENRRYDNLSGLAKMPFYQEGIDDNLGYMADMPFYQEAIRTAENLDYQAEMPFYQQKMDDPVVGPRKALRAQIKNRGTVPPHEPGSEQQALYRSSDQAKVSDKLKNMVVEERAFDNLGDLAEMPFSQELGDEEADEFFDARDTFFSSKDGDDTAPEPPKNG